jgi:hypothetical protein
LEITGILRGSSEAGNHKFNLIGVSLTKPTDGLKAYLEAVEGAFGAEIDFAQLVKVYGTAPDAENRFL